ncbi:MAG: ImmA/IrrE family metallo-endopeptidase, partial [Oscillospiraceae bacterium]|nr:ImmA/IrrE family metallo-endopeptidase [Oscillospiraceae bacterium]
MDPEYYIRRLPFPNRSVKAATFPNDDGTFDIYLNTLFSESEQQSALAHELRHIRLDHFYSDAPIAQKEAEADGISPPAPSPA